MADQFGPKRPLGVTIVAALAIVSGVVDIIGGIVLLAAQSDPEFSDAFGGAALLVSLAIASIVTGALMLLIAMGLLRGNAVARVAATVVQGYSLAVSIGIGIGQPSMLATEIVSALVALAILMLLWSREATRFVTGLAPGEPGA